MPSPTVSLRHTCGNTGVYSFLPSGTGLCVMPMLGVMDRGLLQQRTLEEKRREIFRVLNSQAIFKLLQGSRSFSK